MFPVGTGDCVEKSAPEMIVGTSDRIANRQPGEINPADVALPYPRSKPELTQGLLLRQ
jgi:hypothetical protein